ncbi:MAG TPA: protease inhibitor I42 family protein [Nitrososphaeraceae archaeon]|jgi:inhibitor of cysteine peptidase
MNQILIYEGDKNKSFDANLDDTLIISLKENPTTGYQWKLDHVNAEIISLEESRFFENSVNRIGSGGTRTFTFKARSSGKTKVQLSLKREWEKKMIGVDQFEVFIQVISQSGQVLQ